MRAFSPPCPKVGLHLLPLLEEVHQASDNGSNDGEDNEEEEEGHHACDHQVQRLPCAPQGVRHIRRNIRQECLIFANLGSVASQFWIWILLVFSRPQVFHHCLSKLAHYLYPFFVEPHFLVNFNQKHFIGQSFCWEGWVSIAVRRLLGLKMIKQNLIDQTSLGLFEILYKFLPTKAAVVSAVNHSKRTVLELGRAICIQDGSQISWEEIFTRFVQGWNGKWNNLHCAKLPPLNRRYFEVVWF